MKCAWRARRPIAMTKWCVTGPEDPFTRTEDSGRGVRWTDGNKRAITVEIGGLGTSAGTTRVAPARTSGSTIRQAALLLQLKVGRDAG
jgi:hypothetical protein